MHQAGIAHSQSGAVMQHPMQAVASRQTTHAVGQSVSMSTNKLAHMRTMCAAANRQALHAIPCTCGSVLQHRAKLNVND